MAGDLARSAMISPAEKPITYEHSQGLDYKVEKTRCKVINWPGRNKALGQRGDIAI
jgi:hypothetical protein